MGPPLQESMLIMNMLNKYSHVLFVGTMELDVKLWCSLTSAEGSGPGHGKKTPRAADSCLVSGKVRKHWGGQRNFATDRPFYVFNLSFLLLNRTTSIIQLVNLTTHQSTDKGESTNTHYRQVWCYLSLAAKGEGGIVMFLDVSVCVCLFSRISQESLNRF